MRVLVCGGRDFSDVLLLHEVLGELYNDSLIIIHGAAHGADSHASSWAKKFAVPTLAYPADWKKYGKAAGPIRNQRMIDEGKPDMVIAFPGGKGTADMVKRAKAAGIYVKEIDGSYLFDSLTEDIKTKG